MKKKDNHVTDALRDAPVPPVKGAVIGQRDAVLHPAQTGAVNAADPERTKFFDGWL